MPKTILVVEDSEDDRLILNKKLSALGYKVVEAATGEEALEKAQEEKPDLVLVDTELPGMDGIEVCRQLKQDRKLNSKVIVYTGSILAVEVTKARVAGADAYEVKTRDFAKLLGAVKKLFPERGVT